MFIMFMFLNYICKVTCFLANKNNYFQKKSNNNLNILIFKLLQNKLVGTPPLFS